MSWNGTNSNGRATDNAERQQSLIYIAKWLGVALVCHALAFGLFLLVDKVRQRFGRSRPAAAAPEPEKKPAGKSGGSSDGTKSGMTDEDRMEKVKKDTGVTGTEKVPDNVFKPR
jgi:hypothetical protein